MDLMVLEVFSNFNDSMILWWRMKAVVLSLALGQGTRGSFFWDWSLKYVCKEVGNHFPNIFLIFFLVEGKSFLYDLAWTVSGPCLWVSHVVDPGVLYFPQTLLERAVHFQVLHGGVKFSWGSLCLVLLQAHNPSGSKCLELKRLRAFLRSI